MAKQRTGSARHRAGPRREPTDRPKPPTSDVPPAAPAPSIEEVVPPQVAGSGGVENMPEELLSKSKQVEDELDHAGLDAKFPGEGRADAEDEHMDLPPR